MILVFHILMHLMNFAFIMSHSVYMFQLIAFRISIARKECLVISQRSRLASFESETSS
jgi:hypothetical protein